MAPPTKRYAVIFHIRSTMGSLFIVVNFKHITNRRLAKVNLAIAVWVFALPTVAGFDLFAKFGIFYGVKAYPLLWFWAGVHASPGSGM
jgi:hypothetical protein